MSKSLVGLACFTLLLWGVAQAAGADPVTSHEVTGQVVKVDLAAEHLVVKRMHNGKAEELTFVVRKDARLDKGTRTLTLADLRPGEKVTVTYAMMEHERQAEHVAVAQPMAGRGFVGATHPTAQKMK